VREPMEHIVGAHQHDDHRDDDGCTHAFKAVPK
jgi:hypothetical protein